MAFMENENPDFSISEQTAVADQKNEHFYVLLKVAGRIELYVLAIGILFYVISGSISWRLNVQSTEKYSSIVKSALDTLVKTKLDDLQLSDLEIKIQKKIDENNFPAFSISNFIQRDTSNKPLFLVVPPTVESDKISALEGASSWSRDKMVLMVKNQLDNSTTGLDIYAFIVQGAFTSNFQIGIILFLLVWLSLIIITNGLYYYHNIIKQKEVQKKQDALQAKVQEGKEASPVWELAQLTLNKYYNRNLSQNNWIFYVSVTVMIAGFGLVLYGISLAYRTPANTLVTIVSTGSGVIVQFIGATFLVIYNSTISQAIQYTASLQRVSIVGTSIKILDSIKEDETEETRKDKKYVKLMIEAKIAVAKLLIEQSKEK
jgi:hypothetical protein